MMVRALTVEDWDSVEPLYWELTRSGAVAGREMFETVLSHPGTTVFGCVEDGQVLAMTTLHVLPNLTYGGRPYGLIENVASRAARRGQGLGRRVMTRAIDAAQEAGCYKVMLLTGKGREAKGFYEAVGFSADEKWGMMIRF